MTTIRLVNGNIKVFNTRKGHNFNTIPGYVAPEVGGGQGGDQGGNQGGGGGSIPDNTFIDHRSQHSITVSATDLDHSETGDVIVVGYGTHNAVTNREGGVLVYHYTGSAWESTLLISPNPQNNKQFGASVSINDAGTRIIVSTYEDNNGWPSNGGIYIFEGSGTNWTQTDHLFINGSNNNLLGAEISGDGNNIFAVRHGSDIVWYEYDGSSTWVRKTDIVETTSYSILSFQTGVVLKTNYDGSRLFAGCNDADINPDGTYSGSNNNRGAFVTYSKKGADSYTEDFLLTSGEADYGNYDRFGCDIAVSDDGNKLIVGAYSWDDSVNSSSENGKVYLYNWNGSAFVQHNVQTQPTVEGSAQFGFNVGITPDGSKYMVGENRRDIDGNTYAGMVHEYDFATNALLNSYQAATVSNTQFGYRVDYTADGNNRIMTNLQGVLEINKV